MGDVTRILAEIGDHNPAASEQLFTLVYAELRKLAAAQFTREKPGQTLQATALVHEVYLRLVGSGSQQWSGRNHFFGAAAEAMRRILVDNARRKATLKHGGQHTRQSLDESEFETAGAPADEILAVHEALDCLGAKDPVAADLVKLHYFGGFSLEEAAELVGISRATAYRTWTYARTWLRAALEDATEST